MSTLLDTNVVSELIRESPEPSVARWASGHPVEGLFLSAVSEAELRCGAAILPMGRRRETLLFKMEGMLRDAFEDRGLPFDSEAARAYGHIAAAPRSPGHRVASADCQIAAIAAARRMRPATRNVRDSEDMEIEIVYPWVEA